MSDKVKQINLYNKQTLEITDSQAREDIENIIIKVENNINEISKNSEAIKTLETEVDSNKAIIDSNTDGIAKNGEAIKTLDSKVDSEVNDIHSMISDDETKIANNESNITSLTNRIDSITNLELSYDETNEKITIAKGGN